MKKIMKRSLTLSRQTLVNLTPVQLTRVGGGAVPPTQLTICGTGCNNSDFVCH
jgi:hypothetical protein